MELGEAAGLAGRFVISILFRVHSLPSSERASWAGQWYQAQHSTIPLRAALEESRRHLGSLASRKTVDKAGERHRYVTINAAAHDFGRGRCPQLAGEGCAIYDHRPLTCRTVPFHYSRPASGLGAYLDRFAQTPGYRCDTSAVAEPVLDGRTIVSAELRHARDAGLRLANADRAWKAALLAQMDDPELASAAGLPDYRAILDHDDNGCATMLPMMAAWRIKRDIGQMSSADFVQACGKQAALIRSALSAGHDDAVVTELVDMLAVYNDASRPAPQAAPAIARSR